LVGILIYSSQNIIAQEGTQIHSSIDSNSFPFELTSHNNLSIQAVIGQIDTVNLMFHTAASEVTITQEAAQAMTGIKWNSETNVGSWGGDATARFSESNTVQIGNYQWDRISIWETQNSGPTTGGKFGPNLFENKILEIDFDEGMMTTYNTLPVKIEEYKKMRLVNEDGYMFVEGVSYIEGVPIVNKFLIHSGYGGTILYDDKFVADSKIGSRIEITSTKELKDSYGNVIKVNKGSLPIFQIGEESFTNIPVGFFEGKIGRQQMSVIGGDLLKRFNIIIDAKREFIYFKRNELSNAPYSEF